MNYHSTFCAKWAISRVRLFTQLTDPLTRGSGAVHRVYPLANGPPLLLREEGVDAATSNCPSKTCTCMATDDDFFEPY